MLMVRSITEKYIRTHPGTQGGFSICEEEKKYHDIV